MRTMSTVVSTAQCRCMHCNWSGPGDETVFDGIDSYCPSCDIKLQLEDCDE
jgi:Zn finger protein HypA/HybF involved in hydrogenase expression